MLRLFYRHGYLEGIAGHYSQAGRRILEQNRPAWLSQHLRALSGGLMPPGGPRHISLMGQTLSCAPSNTSQIWEPGCLGKVWLVLGTSHNCSSPGGLDSEWECTERWSQSMKANSKGQETRKGEWKRGGTGPRPGHGGTTKLEPIREPPKASAVKKTQTAAGCFLPGKKRTNTEMWTRSPIHPISQLAVYEAPLSLEQSTVMAVAAGLSSPHRVCLQREGSCDKSKSGQTENRRLWCSPSSHEGETTSDFTWSFSWTERKVLKIKNAVENVESLKIFCWRKNDAVLQ